jgi:predicted outer membrane repeat protein
LTAPDYRLLAFILVLACCVSRAQAATEVTVCGRDDAPGGVNFEQAMAIGGDIVVRCANPRTIEITRTYTVSSATRIDGENQLTLAGTGAAHFFKLTGALELAGLTVRNTNAGGPRTSIATGGTGTLELQNVRTENTIQPYVVDSLVAEDSTFEGNGDAAGYSYGSVVHAQNVTLRRAKFLRNHDHPIAGGAWKTASPVSTARRISIIDSEFTGNRMTSLISDALLTINGSTFSDNGRDAASSGGSWGCCAGALTITQSVAEISNSTFSGNKSYGFGGAIYSAGTRLTLTRTTFDGNSARIGGAVMHVGRPIRNNIWSLTPFEVAPRLTLSGAQFRNNAADYGGGAVAWAGSIEGDAPLFAKNRSGGVGGALANWRTISGMPAEFAGVIATLQSMTNEVDESLAFSRALVVDNVAASIGGIEAGPAVVELGNSILARNSVTGSSPRNSALSASGPVRLVNVTVADHAGGGVALEGAGALTLINTILTNNLGGACVGAAGKIAPSMASIQHPGAACGSTIATDDPALGSGFRPGFWSPARDKGVPAACMAEPVRAMDIYGTKRLAKGLCSIGAVEADLERDISHALPPVLAKHFDLTLWFWIFLLILLLAILLGLLIGCRRRRRKKRASSSS